MLINTRMQSTMYNKSVGTQIRYTSEVNTPTLFDFLLSPGLEISGLAGPQGSLEFYCGSLKFLQGARDVLVSIHNTFR